MLTMDVPCLLDLHRLLVFFHTIVHMLHIAAIFTRTRSTFLTYQILLLVFQLSLALVV